MPPNSGSHSIYPWRSSLLSILKFFSISILISLSNAQLGNIGTAHFDCSRMNPAYCCSSRVRENCPQLCSFRPCNRPKPFIANFLTQLPPMSQVAGFGSLSPQPPPQQPPPALWGQPPPPRPTQTKGFNQGFNQLGQGSTLGSIPSSGQGQWVPHDGLASARGGSKNVNGFSGGSIGNNGNNFNRGSFVPPPQPPPGLVLPPPGTPLASGGPEPPAPIPPPNWESQSRAGSVIPAPASLTTIPRQEPQGPPTHASSGNTFSVPNNFAQIGQTIPPHAQTPPTAFPTLINEVITTTVMPVFGPNFEEMERINGPSFGTNSGMSGTGIASNTDNFGSTNSQWSVNTNSNTNAPVPASTIGTINTTPASLIDQSRRDGHSNVGPEAKATGALPIPKTGWHEELVELGEDEKVVTVEKHGTTNHFGNIQNEIAQSILIKPSQSHITPVPHQRTTQPDRPWSFKISPSAAQSFTTRDRDLPFPEDKDNDRDEFVNLGNGTKTTFELGRVGGLAKKLENGDKNERNKTASGHVNGNNGIFSDKFNVVVDALFSKQTIEAIGNITGTRAPKRPKTQNPHTTSHLGLPTTTLPTTTLATLVRAQVAGSDGSVGAASGQCGIAPDFRPCVEINKANSRLLACCRAKLMPEGCLPLCKFDTTQAEIKRQFDAGKCGILNVAPFLECASQNNDNRACCTHRKLHAKSGPQCEVFCHPRDGLGSLGLQHLVCQNVISDLLQCHHAGIRH